jgi:SAM-dependent methyltransferase
VVCGGFRARNSRSSGSRRGYRSRTPNIAEFNDPRLVAIYDDVNAYGPGEQPDFYAALASELGARTILEFGCGTGMVTADLAERGFDVTGVDPSAAMLDVARQRSSAATWIDGAVPDGRFDLGIMPGHVAQFFVTDTEWRGALDRFAARVAWLSFESRDPRDREWERWPVVRHAGPVDAWSEVVAVDGEVVSYTNHYRFVATGEELVSHAQLRFRSEATLRRTLGEAGFFVERVYGDWDRAPAGPELIVVARNTSVRFGVEQPRDVRDLVERHLALMHSVTPAGHVHALDEDGLADPALTFFGARHDGRLVGVGGLRELDRTHGELKSVHVVDVERESGLGRALLAHLLAVATERGYERVSLETGTADAFAPARSLYAAAGFERCAPFGSYTDNPHSVCMTLKT